VAGILIEVAKRRPVPWCKGNSGADSARLLRKPRIKSWPCRWSESRHLTKTYWTSTPSLTWMRGCVGTESVPRQVSRLGQQVRIWVAVACGEADGGCATLIYETGSAVDLTQTPA
jgi:hypothetical protein